MNNSRKTNTKENTSCRKVHAGWPEGTNQLRTPPISREVHDIPPRECVWYWRQLGLKTGLINILFVKPKSESVNQDCLDVSMSPVLAQHHALFDDFVRHESKIGLTRV